MAFHLATLAISLVSAPDGQQLLTDFPRKTRHGTQKLGGFLPGNPGGDPFWDS